MFRRSVLIVALVFCAPIMWEALVNGSVSLESAGIRFLIAMPVAAILVSLVRMATLNRTDEDAEGATGQDGPDGSMASGNSEIY